MKKILVVDFNGTSSVYTHYLSNGLKSEKNQVKILGKKKPEFLDVFEDCNEYLGVKTGIKLIDYILNWFWLLINYKNFDGIVIQWLQLVKFFKLEVYIVSYLQSRIPLVYIVHNLYPHNSKKGKVRRRYNALYRTCNNIAVQTKEVKKTIKTINPKANIIRIEHGLFFKDFRKNRPQTVPTKCLMVGYVTKYKGVEDALRVVQKLKNQNIVVTLDIIGLGNPCYIDELNKKIESLQVSDRVKIISKEVSTKRMIDKISEASMLWLPYREISQSGVSYTAMGLGVPIVGYDVGNFKEAFGEKNISEIVSKGNIDEFSSAVIKIIENNIFYKRNIGKLFTNDLWKMNKTIIENIFE